MGRRSAAGKVLTVTDRWLERERAKVLRPAVHPLVIGYRRLADRSLIDGDIAHWAKVKAFEPASPVELLRRLLLTFPEFRNIFYHRLRVAGHFSLPAAASRLLPPVASFDLGCDDIGPGFVVVHGYGTIVAAERIGRNCWLHHGVTIGWDYFTGRRPRIGDDVFIGAGAKVFGDVTIGDRVRIGANAVVARDITADSAVSVAATRIRSRLDTHQEQVSTDLKSLLTPQHRIRDGG
jgi:serine O-acetyltransferase